LPLAYKASALGIFTLLSDCNRVIDMNGNRLDLDDILRAHLLAPRWRELLATAFRSSTR